MARRQRKKSRYGMVIDLDRCTGCGACMIACAVENNVPPAHPATNERNGITPMRVFQIENGLAAGQKRIAFLPVLCQQCGEHTPCVSVCPQQAVEVDPSTGIVHQMPQRCLGCRYCMAACPYHARYFNWWDAEWPPGMERTLNPDVSPRMRGVVEKCNFCHGRLHAARARAAAAGQEEIDPADYQPACVEACPAGAIAFGDLDDPRSEVWFTALWSRLVRIPGQAPGSILAAWTGTRHPAGANCSNWWARAWCFSWWRAEADSRWWAAACISRRTAR